MLYQHIALWEMAIKIKIGNLNLSVDFLELAHNLRNNNIEILSLVFEHILAIIDLEDHHGDPFDRVIIAQATFEKMTIISNVKTFINIALSD